MTSKPVQQESLDGLVARFFDEFDTAFRSLDGGVIADRYETPYLACRNDGSAESFSDGAAVSRYFQRIVDRYQSLGVRSCSHHSVEIVWSDAAHTLAEVTWVLAGEDERPLLSWREAYLLVPVDGRLMVRASVDLAPSDTAD